MCMNAFLELILNEYPATFIYLWNLKPVDERFRSYLVSVLTPGPTAI